MQGTQLRRPMVRGSEASIGDRGIAAKLSQDDISGNALSAIHALIVATGRERPLTRLEIRIRCMCAPRPWRDEGISYSTWHRRRRKQRLTVELQADPQQVAA